MPGQRRQSQAARSGPHQSARVDSERERRALIVVIPITYAFFVRMRVEEGVLRAAFPDDYPVYERETRRLVPFIY